MPESIGSFLVKQCHLATLAARDAGKCKFGGGFVATTKKSSVPATPLPRSLVSLEERENVYSIDKFQFLPWLV